MCSLWFPFLSKMKSQCHYNFHLSLPVMMSIFHVFNWSSLFFVRNTIHFSCPFFLIGYFTLRMTDCFLSLYSLHIGLFSMGAGNYFPILQFVFPTVACFLAVYKLFNSIQYIFKSFWCYFLGNVILFRNALPIQDSNTVYKCSSILT